MEPGISYFSKISYESNMQWSLVTAAFCVLHLKESIKMQLVQNYNLDYLLLWMGGFYHG